MTELKDRHLRSIVDVARLIVEGYEGMNMEIKEAGEDAAEIEETRKEFEAGFKEDVALLKDLLALVEPEAEGEGTPEGAAAAEGTAAPGLSPGGGTAVPEGEVPAVPGPAVPGGGLTPGVPPNLPPGVDVGIPGGPEALNATGGEELIDQSGAGPIPDGGTIDEQV